MLGLGSVNGEVMNTLPVNAGRFIISVDGTVGVSIPGTLSAVRRQGLQSAAVIALPATLNAVRRRAAGATGGLQLAPVATAVRRRTLVGSAPVEVSGALTPSRRATLAGLLPIAIDGTAVLSFKYLHQAPHKRWARLHAQSRHFEVAAEERTVVVPARLSSITVPISRRTGE